MAKSMAQIVNGRVANMLWYSENTQSNDTLIDVADRPVGIGDTYVDGKFYRNGAEVLTELEALRAELADARAALEMLGVNADE